MAEYSIPLSVEQVNTLLSLDKIYRDTQELKIQLIAFILLGQFKKEDVDKALQVHSLNITNNNLIINI